MQNKVQPLSSLAVPTAGADPTTDRPDPEVVAKAKRRKFAAKYKRQILAKADAAVSEPGAIGALLRREGLYSSHLVKWRRDREASIHKVGGYTYEYIVFARKTISTGI